MESWFKQALDRAKEGIQNLDKTLDDALKDRRAEAAAAEEAGVSAASGAIGFKQMASEINADEDEGELETGGGAENQKKKETGQQHEEVPAFSSASDLYFGDYDMLGSTFVAPSSSDPPVSSGGGEETGGPLSSSAEAAAEQVAGMVGEKISDFFSSFGLEFEGLHRDKEKGTHKSPSILQSAGLTPQSRQEGVRSGEGVTERSPGAVGALELDDHEGFSLVPSGGGRGQEEDEEGGEDGLPHVTSGSQLGFGAPCQASVAAEEGGDVQKEKERERIPSVSEVEGGIDSSGEGREVSKDSGGGWGSTLLEVVLDDADDADDAIEGGGGPSAAAAAARGSGGAHDEREEGERGRERGNVGLSVGLEQDASEFGSGLYDQLGSGLPTEESHSASSPSPHSAYKGMKTATDSGASPQGGGGARDLGLGLLDRGWEDAGDLGGRGEEFNGEGEQIGEEKETAPFSSSSSSSASASATSSSNRALNATVPLSRDALLLGSVDFVGPLGQEEGQTVGGGEGPGGGRERGGTSSVPSPAQQKASYGFEKEREMDAAGDAAAGAGAEGRSLISHASSSSVTLLPGDAEGHEGGAHDPSSSSSSSHPHAPGSVPSRGGSTGLPAASTSAVSTAVLATIPLADAATSPFAAMQTEGNKATGEVTDTATSPISVLIPPLVSPAGKGEGDGSKEGEVKMLREALTQREQQLRSQAEHLAQLMAASEDQQKTAEKAETAQRQLATARKKVEEFARRINVGSQELKDLERRLAQAESEKTAYLEEGQKMSKRLGQIEDGSKKLRADLKASQAKSQQLQQEVTGLRERCTGLEKGQVDAKGQAKKIADLEASLEKLKTAERAATAQANEMKAKLKELKNENAEMSGAKSAATSLQDEVVSLRRDRDELLEVNRDIQERLDQAYVEMQQRERNAESAVREAAEDSARCRAELEALQLSIAETTAPLSQRIAEMERERQEGEAALRKKLEVAETAAQEAEKAAQRERQAAEGMRAETSHLERRLQTLGAEVEAKKKKIAEMDKREEEMEARVQACQREVAATREECERRAVELQAEVSRRLEAERAAAAAGEREAEAALRRGRLQSSKDGDLSDDPAKLASASSSPPLQTRGREMEGEERDGETEGEEYVQGEMFDLDSLLAMAGVTPSHSHPSPSPSRVWTDTAADPSGELQGDNKDNQAFLPPSVRMKLASAFGSLRRQVDRSRAQLGSVSRQRAEFEAECVRMSRELGRLAKERERERTSSSATAALRSAYEDLQLKFENALQLIGNLQEEIDERDRINEALQANQESEQHS
uniref:TATA element modulatory factor 1 TATA binding domain-containing protein n=1 Tax=Chromera velia CCMP2878 TaxID=1169474 RepID=A0A0G4GFV9_9ALVE|eukprot:Cvel_4649.t1-p1 / transcript=Cvel_4649.t1 / gene=Cvel_4649 / organism=Chromera_velia_CCMP2878 / gene_product=Calponin homology domain-containing protein, putative / transcript_product=Calponin homology domain-containing protein, putative / location=Cvel_scaffold205:57436-66074(+) / protein_length=1297 / sequence_SO=supercontig / SO=protein_coding / is_pseudo=false